MIINKIPKEIANSEIEKGELVLGLDGQVFDAKGSKHSKGGTPVFLAGGTRILSEKLKADKVTALNLVGKDKELSYASMGKPFDTKKELLTLNDKKADKLELETAQLMLTKKLANLDAIYNAQEMRKENDSTNALDSLVTGIDKFQMGGQKNTVYGSLGNKNLPSYARLRTNPINVNQTDTRQLFTNTAFHQKNKYNQVLHNDLDTGAYQMNQIGWDEKLGYLTDPLSVATRRETVKHMMDDKTPHDWNHINVLDSQGNPLTKDGKFITSTLPEGDFRFTERVGFDGKKRPSFVDFANVENQRPMFQRTTSSYTYDATPNDNILTPEPLQERHNLIQPVKSMGATPGLPAIPKVASITPTKPQGEDYLKDIYQMNALRDITDLAGLEIKPPEYNYKPQQVAYQRYLPLNTLAQERQFNIQKEQIENSNLPQQNKSALLSDLYGKLQDSISTVQTRNYAGDLATDNQNTQMYNQVTDANRRERIGYDDKYNELQDRTMFNYGQEKLRLQDRLLGTYAKYKENQFNKNLLNELGDGFYFNGTGVAMKPGYRKTEDSPMQQYSNQGYLQKLYQELMSETDAEKRKLLSETIKNLQGK